MQKYFSCFIAFPLPEPYLSRFQSLQAKLAAFSPHFSLIHHTEPHVTLAYLGNCDSLSVEAAADIVRDHMHLLRDTSIVFRGLKTLGQDQTYGLALVCSVSPNVQKFAENVLNELSFTLQVPKLPFLPQLTLAKFETEEAKRDWRYFGQETKAALQDTMFAFAIKEIIIYGNSKVSGQEKSLQRLIILKEEN